MTEKKTVRARATTYVRDDALRLPFGQTHSICVPLVNQDARFFFANGVVKQIA